ncbi:MAG: aspartate:alanine exchanger family transporter [Candidatus Binatia bacterium]
MLETLLTNKLVAFFTVLTLGLLLGRGTVAGLSLGSSGVIFVALVFGHWGYQIPDGIGALGLVLFVYCVGLTAGPTFFRVFVRQGKALALLSSALVGLGAVTAWGLSSLLELPADLAVGIFAGAMTSTPALAAAMEALPPDSRVPVGYGIAYPFGVVGIVLFVQLLPRILREDIAALGKQLHTEDDTGSEIVRVLVEVRNPVVNGKTLSELGFIAEANCQVSRVLKGKRLVPVPHDFSLTTGQHLLLVGRARQLFPILPVLGTRSEKSDYVMDTEHERRQVVVSAKNVAGHSLDALKLRNAFGVTVTRITRHDLEFVPKSSDVIEYGDALSVVGEPHDLERFASFAGHRARTFDETDMISLGVGLMVGLLLGMVSFDLGGYRFSLGMAGGPLFVSLLLGHQGHIGPVVGHLPRASRMLLMESGLVLFLAEAGIAAGGTLVGIVQTYGIALCVSALLVTFVPMMLSYILAAYVLKMNLLQILGGVCGGMTSTPGLGAITSQTDSDIPVVSYATAYPVALILMTLWAPILVSALV